MCSWWSRPSWLIKTRLFIKDTDEYSSNKMAVPKRKSKALDEEDASKGIEDKVTDIADNLTFDSDDDDDTDSSVYSELEGTVQILGNFADLFRQYYFKKTLKKSKKPL